MKVAVTAQGKDLGDQVDPRFGRCPYFLVVDTDTMVAEAIENPNLARDSDYCRRERVHSRCRRTV
jgi:predicted Fe-Mo cluster-binding NifX family protein